MAAGAVAVYAGMTYAAATAPVIGASIGGALLLLGAIPFVVVVAVLAVVVARRRYRPTAP